MNFHTRYVLIIAVTALATVSSIVLGDNPEPVNRTVDPSSQVAIEDGARSDLREGPLAAIAGVPGETKLGDALLAVVSREAEDIARITADLKTAGNEAAAHALQTEIEKRKKHTRLELLQVQLAYALRAGHEAHVERLETLIDKTLNPAVVPEPSEKMRQSTNR